MTHPVFHAESSVRRFGGKIDDYTRIHQWLDDSKQEYCDFRHRALRHHSLGVYECERVFGQTITNSDGHVVPVRYIAETPAAAPLGLVVANGTQSPRAARWRTRGTRLAVSRS